MNPSIAIGKGSFERQKLDCLVLPIEQGQLEADSAFQLLDGSVGGELKILARQADFNGRADQVFECTSLGRLPQKRIILVGIGNEPEEARNESRFRNFAAIATRQSANGGSARVGIVFPHSLSVEIIRAVAEGVTLGAYQFTKYLSSKKQSKRKLDTILLFGIGRETAAVKRAMAIGHEVGLAIARTRDAVNEPSNVMTPQVFARQATEMARKYNLRAKVLDARGIDRTGMALLSAVGRGSRNEPRFVHLTYSPRARAKKRIVLLGKGLTFDSGGLCIKPAAGMDEMKSDMAGAAAVLGTMQAMAALKPAVEVHGLFVLAENMPDGNAYRPGDVFSSLDGKTVEIINTDAEGRLALADGLAYARKLDPDLIVDVATLTGACMVALGRTCSAFFTTDETWAGCFKAAAERSGESFWQLPLLVDLREQLKSEIADLKHTGERYGGAITAAMFLKEFIGQSPWIHCDVAGPVLTDRARHIYPKGATGHPALTLIRFIEALG